MPLITQIKPQKKQKRFNVFIDGRFAFGLDAEVLLKEGLSQNQEISQKEIERIIKENESQRILEKVLRFLSYRPRSEKEIFNYLIKKQTGIEARKIVIDKLKNLGMIDDLEFAKWWVEQRTTFKPAGKKLLFFELQQKGVSRKIIEQVLNEKEPLNELAVAVQLLKKKKRQWKKIPPEKFKKKAFEFLMQRGFNYEVVIQVVAKLEEKE